MPKPLAVLAYSGGLDTTVILHWLKHHGWDVAAYTANLGQPHHDLDAAAEKARVMGVVDSYVDDLRRELVDEFFLPVLQSHARYEGRYLLGTSIARVPTARGQMRYAKRIGGNVLVHGSTGKGNDQVRFETIYRVLQEDPQFTLQDFGIYAPWKEADFLARFGDGGRRVMTAYSQEHGIPLPSGGTDEGPPYSQDANILHISSEGRALEKPEDDHRPVLFSYLKRWDQTPDRPQRVRVYIEKGRPIMAALLDEERMALGEGAAAAEDGSILPVVEYLNQLGGRHGVGLLDMVESRYVGLKARGVYEAPAHTILLAAHEDLESLVHDHRVLHDKAKRSFDVAEAVYQGRWFTQEMQSWLAANAIEQQRVSGWSEVRLFKGNVLPVARWSQHSLYSEALVSFDTASSEYDPTKARGFIDIQAVEQQAQMRQKRTLGD
ncbi:MAG TPA: argininosuccinate synthase [Dehalococcoidia bacterium]|nr:argininosuccinate synthase [Dehalococcoidia bacterium]